MIHETRPSEPLADALIREARDYRASDQTRKRTFAAVGLVAATPSFWRMHGLKMFLAVLGVGAIGLAMRAPNEVATRKPMLSQHTIVIEAPTVTRALASDPAPVAVETASLARAVNVPAKLPLRAAAPVASSPASTLEDEIAAIDRVRQAVYANDKHAATAGLDDYDRRFPNGKLAPEAQLLRGRASALH